jgi:hypothetical protein
VERSHAPEAHAPNESSSGELEECRHRLAQLEERESRIVELLHCGSADQIEHKLRNLVHELQLMRALAEHTESAE